MSFVTWIGSKKRLLGHIDKIIDRYIADDAIYAEPFLGSGVVLVDVLEKYSTKFSRFICCDLNEALIVSFNQIKSNHQALISVLDRIQSQYLALEIDEQKAFFYEVRDLFNDVRLRRPVDKVRLNEIISSDDDDLVLAALFIFLNKSSFRGVFIVNSKNEFKGSFGYINHPKIVDSQLINRLHQLFTEHDVEFIWCSYDELVLPDHERLLLYLDPPYLETFNKYTSAGFDQEAFIKYLERMSTREGCKVILSNSKEFESVITSNDKVNLPIIKHVSVRDFNNGKTTTAKDRVEILATNIA